MTKVRRPMDHTFTVELTVSERMMVNLEPDEFIRQLKVSAETSVETLVCEVKDKRMEVVNATKRGEIDFS